MKILIALSIFLSFFSLAKSPLIIGLDADLSAVAKEGGIAIKRGAQIAIDEINNQGGVLGHKLKLVSKDHRGNPARGVYNIRSFAKTPNLLAVLGGVHTPVVLQELDSINKHKIPFLIPWAAGTPIVDNGFEPNFVFRLSVRDAEAGQVLLQEAKNNGHSKVGLLLEQTGWGRSNDASMSKAAGELNMNIAHVSWFNWRQKSMVNELRRIKESGATAVMLVANAPEGATIIKEMAELAEFQGLDIYSHWGIASGAFVETVGLDALSKVNLRVLQTYSFVKPAHPEINQKVLTAYRAKYAPEMLPEQIPGAVGVAHAYDLVHLLARAAKRAKSTNPNLIRQALIDTEQYQGLVKHFNKPFGKASQDALYANDYFMAKYNSEGYLVPKDYVQK